MKITRDYFLPSLLGALLAVSGISSGLAGPADGFIDDFAKAAVRIESVSDDVRNAAIEKLKAKPTAQVASAVLRRFYPNLDAAILEPDSEKAVKAMIKLTETGDPYLSAEAHYSIGRRLFADLKHEQALPLFEKVSTQLAGHTLRAGEATYYLGVCQEKMLLKKEALGTFETMVAFFGEDVSRRLRDDAVTRIAQLQRDVDGSLGDVANHMGFSERKLTLSDSGERTVEVQEHIVAMLDELIEQAENSPP